MIVGIYILKKANDFEKVTPVDAEIYKATNKAMFCQQIKYYFIL